jgi:hypothetical protein
LYDLPADKSIIGLYYHPVLSGNHQTLFKYEDKMALSYNFGRRFLSVMDACPQIFRCLYPTYLGGKSLIRIFEFRHRYFNVGFLFFHGLAFLD